MAVSGIQGGSFTVRVAENGLRNNTITIYFRTAQTSAPAVLTTTELEALSYSFTEGSLSGLPSTWSQTPILVEVTSTTDLFYSYDIYVTEDTFGGTQTFSNVDTPTGRISFGSDIQSDNYIPGQRGWSNERDTGDAEYNDITVRGDIISGDWNGTLAEDVFELSEFAQVTKSGTDQLSSPTAEPETVTGLDGWLFVVGTGSGGNFARVSSGYENTTTEDLDLASTFMDAQVDVSNITSTDTVVLQLIIVKKENSNEPALNIFEASETIGPGVTSATVNFRNIPVILADEYINVNETFGIEVADGGSDDMDFDYTIRNIRIHRARVQGDQGHFIDRAGDSEMNSVTIRGDITSSNFDGNSPGDIVTSSNFGVVTHGASDNFSAPTVEPSSVVGLDGWTWIPAGGALGSFAGWRNDTSTALDLRDLILNFIIRYTDKPDNQQLTMALVVGRVRVGSSTINNAFGVTINVGATSATPLQITHDGSGFPSRQDTIEPGESLALVMEERDAAERPFTYEIRSMQLIRPIPTEGTEGYFIMVLLVMVCSMT